MNLWKKGAEADLFITEHIGIKAVVKKRKEKPYKNPVLDEKLRLQRTRAEARMLSRARQSVRTPFVFDITPDTICMEFFEGKNVRDAFHAKDTRIAKEIGERIRALHDIGIIHNDLTTSNMILGSELCFVDFGLAKTSIELEDRATDLVVFKKMLASTHFDVSDKVWESVLSGYNPNKGMLNRIEAIERRVRYK